MNLIKLHIIRSVCVLRGEGRGEGGVWKPRISGQDLIFDSTVLSSIRNFMNKNYSFVIYAVVE